MIVYEFGYCHCIYESSIETISIHKTFAGAYKAMRKNKFESALAFREAVLTYGYKIVGKDNKFGDSELWKLRRTELKA